MTLPTTTTLPLNHEQIQAGGLPLDKYITDLVFSLQRKYEDVVHVVNGTIRRDVDSGARQFIPTVSGATIVGVGTYVHQDGWVLRQGLMVDFWFDIHWTAHTGTGTLLVDLPYQCALSNHYPFVGVISAANITFNGYLTGMVDTGTRNMLIHDNISAGAFINITVPNADTKVRGNVRYVGVQVER